MSVPRINTSTGQGKPTDLRSYLLSDEFKGLSAPEQKDQLMVLALQQQLTQPDAQMGLISNGSFKKGTIDGAKFAGATSTKDGPLSIKDALVAQTPMLDAFQAKQNSELGNIADNNAHAAWRQSKTMASSAADQFKQLLTDKTTLSPGITKEHLAAVTPGNMRGIQDSMMEDGVKGGMLVDGEFAANPKDVKDPNGRDKIFMELVNRPGNEDGSKSFSTDGGKTWGGAEKLDLSIEKQAAGQALDVADRNIYQSLLNQDASALDVVLNHPSRFPGATPVSAVKQLALNTYRQDTADVSNIRTALAAGRSNVVFTNAEDRAAAYRRQRLNGR